MGDQRDNGIAWTDQTWNPIRGCSRVSEGCRNCYAERVARRFSGPGMPYEGLTDSRGHWNGTVRLVREHLGDPLRWRRPRKIFVNSMSDLFHESLHKSDIDQVFDVMRLTRTLYKRKHIFQVLTKRPALMQAYVGQLIADMAPEHRHELDHIWLGTSCENNRAARKRIWHLLKTPAAVRFLSCEPLLGPIDLGLDAWFHPDYDGTTFPGEMEGSQLSGALIHWVIIGAESGPGARPMDLEWARLIVRQCARAGVAVFVKQLCEAGRPIPIGRWPMDLQLRQWPARMSEVQ